MHINPRSRFKEKWEIPLWYTVFITKHEPKRRIPMNIHITIPAHWQRWFQKEPQLPTHLPRLLLAKRFQPRFVQQCRVAQSLIPTLALLDWEQLPTNLTNKRTGWRTIPLSAYVGAFLVKLDQQLPTFGRLHRFLREHPALIWALGFPLVTDATASCGFNIEDSLPTQRHFSRKLSEIPNEILQNLLDAQVSVLQQQFQDQFGQIVSLDTKHILSWVKENNHKAFIKEGRFDKTRQPSGDSDCKLGCKRRQNQKTPTKEGEPVKNRTIGEYYWGYASGAAVTKVADFGEFILAEVTQTFDHPDVSYFFPLMDKVEQRLGFRPPFGTADAAFDAFYVYDYFHSDLHEGFAAVPLHKPNQTRFFDKDGLPLCEAGLAMSLGGTYINRTSFVQHRRGRYVCPLLHPEPMTENCPVDHTKWTNGGCKLVMPTAIGARIRYQVDRESDCYKAIYQERTAVERIFSQAVALGIERPKLRNQRAIANQNTLTYILINLRTMHRISQH